MKIKIVQEIIDKIRCKEKINKSKLNNREINHLNYCINSLKKNKFYTKHFDYKNKTVIFTDKDLNLLTDFEYPWVLMEIFGDNIYKSICSIDMEKQYTLIDIGANRGYTSLYFAQQKNIKNVFCFELVKQTYDFLIKNINLNPKLKSKIKPFCFGLSNKDAEIEIMRLNNRDGCNTINKDFLMSFMPEEEGKGIPQIATIKKASTVLKQIINENDINNIILKIDVEGSEYDIIDDLNANYPEIFEKIIKVIGETHLGFEKFYNRLSAYDYKIVHAQPNKNGTCPFELIKIKYIQENKQ